MYRCLKRYFCLELHIFKDVYFAKLQLTDCESAMAFPSPLLAGRHVFSKPNPALAICCSYSWHEKNMQLRHLAVLFFEKVRKNKLDFEYQNVLVRLRYLVE